MRAEWKFMSLVAVLAAGLLAVGAARGDADYPSRPVTLIVPYAAGGVADVGMRMLGDKLSERLKQPFVVVNRPGAGAIAATESALMAPADGYTVLMIGNNNAIAAAVFKSLAYDIVNDFDSIATAAFFDVLIVTRADSPMHSVADVIAAARASPGKLNVGTNIRGSSQNLAADLFLSSANVDMAIVPFRTSPDMAAALLRGDVDVAFEFYAAVQGLLADKKIVVLASAGATRTAYLPDVPTAIESGLPGYEVTSWNGLAVSKGTPSAVVTTLGAAMKDVIPTPELQDKAIHMGMAMRWSTPEDMAARMKADIAKWGAVVAKTGLTGHE